MTPIGIGINATGYVYVTDTDSSTDDVVIFDADGNYLDDFGSMGSGTGQFIYPYMVAFSSAGNVYVMDSGNSRVQVFDADGNYLSLFRIYHLAASDNSMLLMVWTINSTGYLYVADTGNNRIEVFDPTATTLQSSVRTGAGTDSIAVWWVTFNGRLRVRGGPGNHRVEVFDKRRPLCVPVRHIRQRGGAI